jgi:hypothetical protein
MDDVFKNILNLKGESNLTEELVLKIDTRVEIGLANVGIISI